MFADSCSDTCAELVAGGGLWHATDETGRQLHGVLAVAAEETVAAGGLRCGTIDDGNEVRSDDDAVLAFLRGIFRNEGLLDDLHLVLGNSVDDGSGDCVDDGSGDSQTSDFRNRVALEALNNARKTAWE